MKYIAEFRNHAAGAGLAAMIREAVRGRVIRIMEICGGHTITIFKSGLRELLPEGVRLISGPGCPVCVTHNTFIDHAIALSALPGVTITSFGDMMRVPGSASSLQKEKARGADIRICYSPLDALEIARTEPGRKIVFLGIGFETTAPGIAATIKRAYSEGLRNFTVLGAMKTVPAAMRALVAGGEVGIDAFICPGHVSTITGLGIYEFLARDFNTPCVVSGFEPLDMLRAIHMIALQLKEGRAAVENQYTRTASSDGNPKARAILDEVFVPCDVAWRGIGVIPGSGLAIAPAFGAHDASAAFDIRVPESHEHPLCICGDIMRGMRTPHECGLFAKACTPENPVGACMVSDEGSCATYYKYARPA